MNNDANIVSATDRNFCPSGAALKCDDKAATVITGPPFSPAFRRAGSTRTGNWPAILLLWLLPVLAGCAGIPIQSLYQLSRIDFETTDPQKIRAAVRLPFQVSPLADSVILTMTAYDEQDKVFGEEMFILEHVADAGELAEVTSLVKPGTAVTVFRIRAADMVRLNRFHRVTMRKPGGGKRGGALTLTAKGCFNDSRMPKKIPMTTFLKTVESPVYFQISPEIDLLGGIGRQKSNGEIQPCGAPPA